ncbi:hypothetical protein E2C01_091624 [Portunus trituberculatus]|uniref:Uncharacterized protein n=1 Tax=Portunus trituberculatus TaxID=210409 RepID=A0A5B7JTB9_PORTR|nr:hypothetical protein [Portunus trituberculatus]
MPQEIVQFSLERFQKKKKKKKIKIKRRKKKKKKKKKKKNESLSNWDSKNTIKTYENKGSFKKPSGLHLAILV